MGVKRVFLGCIFCAFLVFCVKNTGGNFLYGDFAYVVWYILWYMLSLNESQLLLLGWSITIGSVLIVIGLTLLLSYCLYSLYRVIKNFSKKY